MSDPANRDSPQIGEVVRLDLTQLAWTCGTTTTFIEDLVLEGVLVPETSSSSPAFGGDDILRVRKVLRLQRDFEATLPSAAVILDLLDEIERLHGQLRQAGRAPARD
jgi:chaperone modulatory protein CbpM